MENMQTKTKIIGDTTYIVYSPILDSKEDEKAIYNKVKTLILNNIKLPKVNSELSDKSFSNDLI